MIICDAHVTAKAAVRPAVPRQKKAQPPEMRIKAPKRKKKIRARAMIGPSPFKECLWTREVLRSHLRDY